ncbi:MAG TPA: type II secretion system F family protein [Caulobacteraceae bacterium]
MADADQTFAYVAVDAGGRRVRGQVSASDDVSAFDLLKREGLSPLQVRPAAGKPASRPPSGSMSDRDIAQFMSSLAALLKAGADMRSALAILGRTRDGKVAAFAKGLSSDIGGGGAIDAAFEQRLPRRHDFIAALIAAGEAGGDLAGGLDRAAEMMTARLKLTDQLVSVLSYPAFVFVSTLGAVAVILFFVVPSLAPLVEDSGAKAPLILGLLISVSTGLRANLVWIAGAIALLAVLGFGAYRAGMMQRPMEGLTLDGPVRATARAIVFGGYAVALGSVLVGGASMSDALRLAARSVRSSLARQRLEPVAIAVREGTPLSAALEGVAGFPQSVIQLTAVGEASGALGAMLARAGRLEEEAAIRRIESLGRVLGPALIVALGGLIGLLMAGLLSGVTQLGQVAAQ